MISLIRSFIFGDRKGVAAIEFGLLAPAFFMLMIGIFEICYYVYMSTATQRAVEKAIYDLRTNHAATVIQQDGLEIDQWYRQAICKRVLLSSCEQTIQVTIAFYDDDMNQTWQSAGDEELLLAPRETVMRVEAAITVPTIMFTELIFGDEAAEIKTGITFMTEP